MISASIVTYRTAHDEVAGALACLASPVVQRIDVVDNGADPGLHAVCDAGNAHYIDSEANLGYGAGHNISLRRSLEDGTAYHLVMNSDIGFSPEILGQMAAYMDSHPEVALLHPRIVGADGADQYTVRMLPTPFDLLLRRFLPSCLLQGRRNRYLLKHLPHDGIIDASYVQGSFMLLRVDALRECGLFDERFFMYPEDIDLSRRLARIGRVRYYPQATVVHAHRAESYKSLRMTWVHLANMARYFNKWGWLLDAERRTVNRRLGQSPQ